MIRNINSDSWKNYKRLEDAAAACKDTNKALSAVHELISDASNVEIIWIPDNECEKMKRIFQQNDPEERLAYLVPPYIDYLRSNGFSYHEALSEAYKEAADAIQNISSTHYEIRAYSEDIGMSKLQNRLKILDASYISSEPIREADLYALLAAYMSTTSVLPIKAALTLSVKELCISLAIASYAVYSSHKDITRFEPFSSFLDLIESSSLKYVNGNAQALSVIKDIYRQFIICEAGMSDVDKYTSQQITLSFMPDKILCQPDLFKKQKFALPFLKNAER